jgi:predicted transcriptional regulator
VKLDVIALGSIGRYKLNEIVHSFEKPALEEYNVLHSIHSHCGAVMGVTSVRLQPEIENPLEDLANKLGRSKNYLINQAIKEFIARQSLEDERWQETLQAIKSVEAGQDIQEKEVACWLDSWGAENELEPPHL